MINDWKLGMRMLRYAHGIKMNCIAAGLVKLLEIPAVILGRMNGNGFPAFYMLLVAGMLPTQALFSLSVAGMAQASPLKKKLQTKIPALMNFSIMAAIYLTGGLFCGIMCWGKAENREFIYENMIILAIAIAAIMVYMGVAYKHFIAASAGLLPVLCFMMSKGLSGKGCRTSCQAGEPRSGRCCWEALRFWPRARWRSICSPSWSTGPLWTRWRSRRLCGRRYELFRRVRCPCIILSSKGPSSPGLPPGPGASSP